MSDFTYPHVSAKAGHCLWCGIEVGFFKNGKPKKWCSRYCGTSGASFRSTGRIAPKSKPALRKSTQCAGCGRELSIHPRNRNPKKWCSQACSARGYREANPDYVERQAVMSKARNRKRAEERELVDPLPRCENCGERMATRREDRRFCNADACQSASYQAWKSVAPRCSEGCDQPVQAHGLCAACYSTWWRSENPDKAYAVRARYRARKRDAWVEDVDRDVVLKRDRWVCGICGEKIPRTAIYPDPLSPSIDHVIPLAVGGEHSYANTQASHFLCNSVKQHRGEGEQLALI